MSDDLSKLLWILAITLPLGAVVGLLLGWAIKRWQPTWIQQFDRWTVKIPGPVVHAHCVCSIPKHLRRIFRSDRCLLSRIRFAPGGRVVYTFLRRLLAPGRGI